MNYFVELTFLLITIVQIGDSAKILGIFSSPTKSHMIIYKTVMEELAKRGHEVTFTSSFPSTEQKLPNYRHIYVEVNNGNYEENVAFPKFLKDAESNQINLKEMLPYLSTLHHRSEQFLLNSEIEKLKQNETFDLIIFGYLFNDFQLGLAAHFKCPYIMLTTMKASSIIKSFTGCPNAVSFVPSFLRTQWDPLNFWHRLRNFFIVAVEYAVSRIVDYFVFQPYYEKHFPQDQYPSLDEIRKNVSLILINNHFSQNLEPYLPNMIDYSGIQIKAGTKPLPKNVQEFLDEAKNGAIYFSLGTNMKSTQLSKEKLDEILRVFGQLKQKVLWKWEDDSLPGKPDNVMISKWFPQSSILAHPNTKLFISHCGLSSIQEAKYHGVPILGIPIFADQPDNVRFIENEGWATSLKLSELNEHTFSGAINEHLTNETYFQAVKKLSNLYKDRPQDPLDSTIYWIEYVLRHNGAKHLRSAALDLNIFQYNSLDVIGFIVLTTYLFWKVVQYVSTKMYRKLMKKIKKD